jgi:hypothetical protein
MPAAPAAAKAADKDPSAIACPTAPNGWYLPANGGKKVEDSQTDVRLTPSDVVTIACNYFTRSGTYILVNLQYALPTDPNPNSDFYYGCGSANGTPWDDNQRMFRIASGNEWANASFFDPTHQLTREEIIEFETVTRSLLRNAEGYGHDCSLTLKPSTATSKYSFAFALAAGNATGSFVTKTDQTSAAEPVIRSDVPDIKLKLGTTGTPRTLTIRVRNGIEYRPGTATRTGTVQFAVQVIRSNTSSCRKGAVGTLTVSTAPSVSLHVCGRNYLRGRAATNISLLN